jgi:Holliday junction resolvase RusA-like endonuclease
MHMKLHQSKPDIDNCIKALFDSLVHSWNFFLVVF